MSDWMSAFGTPPWGKNVSLRMLLGLSETNFHRPAPRGPACVSPMPTTAVAASCTNGPVPGENGTLPCWIELNDPTLARKDSRPPMPARGMLMYLSCIPVPSHGCVGLPFLSVVTWNMSPVLLMRMSSPMREGSSYSRRLHDIMASSQGIKNGDTTAMTPWAPTLRWTSYISRRTSLSAPPLDPLWTAWSSLSVNSVRPWDMALSTYSLNRPCAFDR